MNKNRHRLKDSQRGLSTFEGTFTPTILTILGVIMYLRLGWVVGNAGFGGAVLIIIVAHIVTIFTGLSIASIATNVRVGAGGFYALISRSLGPEVGSAIGIPLFLSQTLSGALYIIGFTEGWLSIFPDHHPQLVSTIVLLGLLLISLISAKVAMRVQFIVMAIIAGSLISFFMGHGDGSGQITLWGNFGKAPFWVVFAIFFPAVTGIGAGAALSGDLKDPRKSLPFGILSAIGVSFFIYILVAFWFDRIATTEQLQENYTIIIDVSRWKFLVIAGILGATLSSALGSIVGAPRTLMALAQDKIIPLSKIFAKKSRNGEPRIAILFSALITEVVLILGDLNTIAPLLTMFFLITYGTTNTIVAIEKIIGIPSFRPTFSIPLFIPIIGSIWSLIIMFLIDPLFAGIAMFLILISYIIQVKRNLRAPWGDVRSGIFIALAEWAAKTSTRLPQHAKTWKPNLMIPVEDPASWSNIMNFIRDIVFPKGTLRLFSLKISEENVQNRINSLMRKLFRGENSPQQDNSIASYDLQRQLDELVDPLSRENIFVVKTVIECNHFLEGINIITQVQRGMYFPPNTVFLTMSTDPKKDEKLAQIIAIAVREHLGVMVLSLHPKLGFGNEKMINVWLRSKSPNKDLALLTALQLEKNWDGNIRIISSVHDEHEQKKVHKFLNIIADRARIPAKREIHVLKGDFYDTLKVAPPGDLHIFGTAKELNLEIMRKIVYSVNATCLFIKDSGKESVFV